MAKKKAAPVKRAVVGTDAALEAAAVPTTAASEAAVVGTAAASVAAAVPTADVGLFRPDLWQTEVAAAQKKRNKRKG
jgi:hypothetical protein